MDYVFIMERFERDLYEEEYSVNTIKKYIRDVNAMLKYIGEGEMSKIVLIQYKEKILLEYKISSVNSMIASVNKFLTFCKKADWKLKPVKMQKEIFTNPNKELSAIEYRQLVCLAEKKGNYRLSYLLQTMCSTGIRVSELQYITVESLMTGRSIVECKRKKG